ncbi:SLOG family protein [Paenibacillus sp. NAIST15-1]|uniref:SLOG family protein n=1 Tax=Paenibacillus sp. NAIST15-1 TaxID=1605994 RepID=UPI00086F2220|nr:SLOG family protein [Paenibacillus sp. NAIST15-1]GAV11396.1 hypothetical protein PBN151_1325 [Paenibacillus sp. NAIST15-1]
MNGIALKLPTVEEIKQSRLRCKEEGQLERVTCGFTGHRPSKLGGCYSLKHPESLRIVETLKPILEQLINEEGIRQFISGGAIGFDQIAFWTVQSLKKQYPELVNIVAVPFKNQPCKWTDKETLHWYNKMLQVADEVIYVDTLDKYSVDGTKVEEYHVAKMQKRNEFMVDKSRVMIACYDGSRGGTGNCVAYLTKKGKTLYQINPNYNYKLEVRYGIFH